MKNLIFTNKYKKQWKEVSHYPSYDDQLLKDYIVMLQKDEKLPDKARDHKLAEHSRSEYQGCRDFHLSPDIVVVYRVTNDIIEFVAIGKHNKLKLTSSWNYKTKQKAEMSL